MALFPMNVSGGGTPLIPEGKYRWAGTSSYGTVTSLTEASITNNVITINVATGVNGLMQANVSNKSQVVIGVNNPPMYINLMSSSGSKGLLLSWYQEVGPRTINLSGIDYMTVGFQNSGSGSQTVTFTFS